MMPLATLHALAGTALPADDGLTFTLPHVVAGIMVVSLNAYVLLGGADFGGGVWDLLARGRQREEQRAAIAQAIGPIWEANHVWLILVVVLLFTCYPRVFAHLATELHVPITLMLVGVVLRGSAFTFRTYDSTRDEVQRRWGRIFSMSSVVTPVLLGVCVGTVASARVPMRNGLTATATFSERFVDPWLLSPFAWSVGFMSLALFATLAATYLTVEQRGTPLEPIFRKRALQSQGVLLLLALLTIVLSSREAPLVYRGLTVGSIALLMHAVTALSATTSIVALMRAHYQLARLAAAAQASFILWGWAWSQYPILVPPDLRISDAAAPRVTLQVVVLILGIGTAILLPSFVYLFRVFKRGGSAFERE